jgi:hypothetical protein
VVTDVDGETAEDGGGISSLLPDKGRSSSVEKLLKVDFSRFEDGDMLGPVSQNSKSARIQCTLTFERSFRRRRQVGPFRSCEENEHGA